MPPRARYTREQIIEVAFEMARETGIESIAARELGKRLGTSSSPIFTAFKNMEELCAEVRKRAMFAFENDFVQEAATFKEVGIKMIQFASEEPKLFQLLFMQESQTPQSINGMVASLGDTVGVCLDLIERDYQLSRSLAELLFQQVWIYTFGICVLISTKVCCFTPDEVSGMLTGAFQGILISIKMNNQ